MAQLNNALEDGNDNCMFVTLFLGVLDLNTLQLRFASAGHTPPSLLRDGSVQIVSQEDGPALGLASDQEFPINTLQLTARRPAGHLHRRYRRGVQRAGADVWHRTIQPVTGSRRSSPIDQAGRRCSRLSMNSPATPPVR